MLLAPDYIDELVLKAGMTDIGVEPKAVRVTTLQHIAGIADAALTGRYMETAWQTVVVQTELGHVGPESQSYRVLSRRWRNWRGDTISTSRKRAIPVRSWSPETTKAA